MRTRILGAGMCHFTANAIDQWHAAHPPKQLFEHSKLAAVNVESGSRLDLSLPVRRDVVAQLGQDDMSEEARIDHAAQDRHFRHRCPHHGLALAARANPVNVADHREARRQVGRHLGDVNEAAARTQPKCRKDKRFIQISFVAKDQ